MYIVKIGYPLYGPRITVKKFTDRIRALHYMAQLNLLLGVQASQGVNVDGVCAQIDEE